MSKPISSNRLTAQIKVRYTALRKRAVKNKTAFVKKYQQFCVSLKKIRLQLETHLVNYKKRFIRIIKSIYQPILIEVTLIINRVVDKVRCFLKKINMYYLASGKGSFINRQHKSILMFYRKLTEKRNKNARYWYLHIKLDSLSDIIGYIVLFRCFICFLFCSFYSVLRIDRSVFEIFLLFCNRTLIYI